MSINWYTKSQGPKKKSTHFTKGRIHSCLADTARYWGGFTLYGVSNPLIPQLYVLLKNQRIQAHLEKYIDFLKQNDSYFHIGYDNKPNFGVPKSYFTHYVNPALMISMTLGL